MSNASPKVVLVSDRTRIIEEVPAFKSIVTPHPSYVAELRKRVEGGPGVMQVAKHAKMSRQTIWRMFKDPMSVTVEAAERVRLALIDLEPHGGHERLPPVVVSVVDQADHDAIAFIRKLRERDPAKFEAVLSELRTPPKKPRRR